MSPYRGWKRRRKRRATENRSVSDSEPLRAVIVRFAGFKCM